MVVGGENEWCMLGHAYFSRIFSQKFIEILMNEYDKIGVDQMFWEDIYAEHLDELEMYIRKYDDGIIFEFDTLDDLRKFDPKYINNTDSRILKNICSVLDCKEADIKNIIPIKKGSTNTSFLFECRNKKYVYRHPGSGTEEIINRVSEAKSQNLAKELKIDETLIYISAEEGWKISHFIDDCVDFDYHNIDHVKKGLSLVKKLHDANVLSQLDFNMYSEAEKLISLMDKTNHCLFVDLNLRESH